MVAPKQVMALFLVLAYVQTTTARTPQAFRGLSGLSPPAGSHVAGSTYSHQFHHISESGRHTKLHYEAELAGTVRSLDAEDSVEAVVCHDDRLEITLASGQSHPQEWAIGEFVVGSHIWGCTRTVVRRHTSVSIAASIHRNITGITAPTGSTWILHTQSADLTHMFRHVKAKFLSNNFGPGAGGDEDAEEEALASPAGRRPLSWLSHSWSSVKHGFHKAAGAVAGVAQKVKKAAESVADKFADKVKAYGSDLETVGKAIYDIGKLLLTGKMHGTLDKTESITWNFNHLNDGPVKLWLPVSDTPPTDVSLSAKCAECYVNMDLSFHMDLEISDYKVKTVGAALEGEAEALFMTTMNKPDSISAELEAQLAQIQIASFVVFIGPVPFVVDINLDMGAGLSWEMSVSTTAPVSVLKVPRQKIIGGIVHGDVPNSYPWNEDHGLQSHGGWQYMFVRGGGMVTEVGGAKDKVDMSVTASLEPGIALVVDKVVTFELYVEPYLKLSLAIDGDDPDELHQSLAGGMNVAARASLNFDVFKLVFGPWTIYTTGDKVFQHHTFNLAGAHPRRLATQAAHHSLGRVQPASNLRYPMVPRSQDNSRVVTMSLTPPPVPNNSSVDCNGRGTFQNDRCSCFWGWLGDQCDQVAPSTTRLPCDGDVVVPSNLQTCSALNGHQVCGSADTSAMTALDQEIHAFVSSEEFSTQGPACVEAMRQYQCQLKMPIMRAGADHIHKICFEDCARTWQLCGADPLGATQKCKLAATSAYSHVAHRTVTDRHQSGELPECEMLPRPTSRSETDASKCVKAQDLVTCSANNGYMVHLEHGMGFNSLAAVDSRVGELVALGSQANNTGSKACKTALATIMCAEWMPRCDIATGAQQEEGAPAVTIHKLCPDTCQTVTKQCPGLEAAVAICTHYELPSVDLTVARAGDTCSFQELAATPASATTGSSSSSDNDELLHMSPLGFAFTVAAAFLVGIGSAVMGYRHHHKKQRMEVARRAGHLEPTRISELTQPMLE